MYKPKSTKEEKQLLGKWLEPEEVVATSEIQFRSLLNFMSALDYEWRPYIRGSFFYSGDYDNRHRANISFRTAVELHNITKSMRAPIISEVGPPYPFHFNLYKVRKALAARIVHKVNLQLCKKTNYVKNTNNFVQFVFPEYEELFLNSKHL